MLKAAQYPIKKRIKLYGFDISIENPRGSTRTWKDPHSGESGSTKMRWAYGYIRRTEGTDGDHVDVYIGPELTSTKVFVINQMKKPDFREFDEQKVMLAFPNATAAKAAYLKQYNDPRFFGSMKEMSIEDFRKKVLDKGNHGEKIADDSKRRDRLRKAGLISGIAALPLTAMAVRQLVKTPEAFPAWGLVASTAAGASAVLSHMAHAPKGKQEKDMPFKSKRQQRAAFAGAIPGISKEKARERAHGTPNIKGLPDRAPAEKGKPTLRSKESQFIKEAVSPQWIARGATGGMVQRFSKAGVATHPDVARGIYRSIREGIPDTDAAIQRFGQAVGGTTDQIAHEVRSGRRAFMKAALPPSSAVTPALHEQALSKIQDKVAQLAHAHDTGANLDEASVRRGMKVEMEHTKNPATARQIAIDHLRESPDYYEKLQKVEKRANHYASYFTELNLSKLAAGGELVDAGIPVLGESKKRGLGDDIPPQTEFAQAVKNDSIKAAAEDRAGRIADRLDDLGISILAAPYAASGSSKLVGKIKKPWAQAAAKGLSHAAHAMHGSDARELVGLSLVAPGVTHAIAKKIDKATKTKKASLEKIAEQFFPDFEYKTEPEKQAVLRYLEKLAFAPPSGPRFTRAVMGAARNAGHAEARAVQSLAGVSGVTPRALVARVPAPVVPQTAVVNTGKPVVVQGAPATAGHRYRQLPAQDRGYGRVETRDAFAPSVSGHSNWDASKNFVGAQPVVTGVTPLPVQPTSTPTAPVDVASVVPAKGRRRGLGRTAVGAGLLAGGGIVGGAALGIGGLAAAGGSALSRLSDEHGEQYAFSNPGFVSQGRPA